MKKLLTYLCRAVALAALLTTVQPASAALTHRYSFTTNANDSVGTAHGTAVQRSDANGPIGSPVVFQDGQAVLDGLGGYIDLPNGLFSSLTNVTIESWVTWSGGGQNWARIFDFGNSTSGETSPSQAIGTGLNYMFLTPNGAGSARARFAITDASNGAERPILNDTQLFPVGAEAYVVVTYGQGFARVYVNGRLAASGAAPIPLSALQDVNNWLGRSNWNDPMFGGSFNEFRIHDSILGGPEIKAGALAGPNVVNYDAGTVNSITLQVQSPVLVGQLQTPQIKATFSVIGDVDLGGGDVTLTSSSTNVVRVTAAGLLQGFGIGTATITAARGGKSATASVTVNPAAPAALKNRYSFSDAVGSTTVADAVGGKNGTIRPPFGDTVPLVLTNGQVLFPAAGATNYQTSGYIDLPDGIISSRSNITIETWVTWNGPNAGAQTWARIFDFGDSTKGDDAQFPGTGAARGYLFLTPRAGGAPNPVRFAAEPVGGAENPVLNGTGPLPVGQESHVVVVYAPQFQASRLYVNGILLASGGAPFQLSQLSDVNNWLGQSQYGDPPYSGFINEFRIYEGPLTDLEVALSRAAGPDALAPAPGALQSISLTAVPLLLVGNPAATQSTLIANFQNTTNVNVTTVGGAALSSSDTNIFTLNATGGILPRNAGTATFLATFQGLSSTTSVSVTAPIALRHEIATNTLNAGGVLVAAILRADFSTATNVNVGTFAGVTRSSSDANVLTIAANGNVTAIATGTATITSAYAGLTAQTVLNVVLPAGFQRGQLIHRYSFNGAPDTRAVSDSVGTAHGELAGLVPTSTNNNFTGTGQVDLGGGAWNADPLSAYVNLPNGLVSSLTSVTLEGWAIWRGGAANQRFFDFGISTDANGNFVEDVIGVRGRSYMFLTPSGPRFAINQGTAGENPSVTSSVALTLNTNSHFAVVYDPPNGVVRLYINGRRTGTAAAVQALSTVDDRNAWLGRSVWQDPLFNGQVDEFRIYNGPLLDADVAASFAAGPNNLPIQAPALTARIAGGKLEITWPSSATGYILETTPALGAAWTPVATAPTPDGGNQKVTITIGAANAFYRLRK